ncbi:MAG: 16S rRNA (adenine(1518)-N(6)/adenine(1519)-N(6))-dimethyltransferase RsmA [Endomicrobium sp.]|jgi:16S rRNA (adenine1518-N6/adenine1519-N6)-dimethyltransferase|nr:16S rRNA (adenine(1518)-N(6)/adenine(1519)-N(6))-dimethyltransferase RsmA [Endomicrobium sp.]
MRQKYGQNFLIDNNIANNIVKLANLEKDDQVLEIGPGKGILTKIIQPQVKRIIAVEIDNNLFKQLFHYFSCFNIKNIDIINADFLKFNIPNIKFKVISTLPYNIGTAIIQKILPLKNWSTAVFVLQKEVAQRLVASYGNKNYGYISIFTSYYANSVILFNVSPRCFNPPPKVFSSVIKLTNKFSLQPDSTFFNFIKHIFTMRRKTILNCITSFKNLKKVHIARIMNNLQLDPFSRPDELSPDDFLRLTNEIKKHTIYRV